MSFINWNKSGYDLDQQSLQIQNHELLTIGITNNKLSLSCIIDTNAHDYKYCRTHAEMINAIFSIFKKHVVDAFQKMQKVAHYHRDHVSTLFLPEAINHGNYGAMTKFLQQLKTNKVGSYVKLSMKETKGYFLKGATLLKPVLHIIKDRLRFALIRLKKNAAESILIDQKNILSDIDKISSIAYQKSVNGQGLTNKKDKNHIKLTYTHIYLSGNRKKRHSPINVKELIKNSNKKQYFFQNLCAESNRLKEGPKTARNRQVRHNRNDSDTENWVLNHYL